MATPLPPTLHTVYAELVERASMDQLQSDFPTGGSFYKVTIKGRDYWYYKPSTAEDPQRSARYVGPDSDETRQMIARHGEAKSGLKERRQLVKALRHAGLTGPDALTGKVLAALAMAGVFRLRALVVGSFAYQTYGGLLGYALSARNAMTADLDVAQFLSISMKVEDAIEVPFAEVLKKVDPRFRPLEGLDPGKATRFALGSGKYRVEVLTPNEGPDSNRPVHLPALQADGQPLRFLDFLIREEVKAVVLYRDGVLINVPSPERFAIHKLIVHRLRQEMPDSQAKAQKDLSQAAELIDILLEQRPFELREVWQEARSRGAKWRQYLDQSLAVIDHLPDMPNVRDRFLSLVGGSKKRRRP